MSNKEKIELLIEGILRMGGSKVSTEGLDEEAISSVIQKYQQRGWNVEQQGGQLLFEAKGKRTLLKG